MEYIHIRNLEKYHPGYKDRDLKWAKLYFTMVQGDPEFEVIKNETDKWRFAAMICLELEAKTPLPNIDDYWQKKFNLKNRPMSLTLQMLQKFIEVVTEDLKLCTLEESKNVEEISIKNKSYCGFEETTLTSWNYFCDKYPTLTKIKEISSDRRLHLKKRFMRDSFRDFHKILEAIETQPFLLNGNPNNEKHKDWRISFDWLIDNDTNYLKVLEGKYKNQKASIITFKE
jgi:hypothetical protein